jgi:uncharacterized membrane protein
MLRFPETNQPMPDPSVFDVLSNPQMRHAAIVHLPIALSAIGVVLAIISAIATSNKTLRITSLAAFVLLAIASWMGTQSGEAAFAELSNLSPAADALIEEHEHLAEKIWLFALGAVVLTAIALSPSRGIRLSASWLAVLVSAAGAMWVANAAHHGGLAVYAHGVGIQQTASPLAPPANVAAQTEPERQPPEISEGASLEFDPPPPPPPSDARLAFFESSVLPVLTDHCMRCHNPRRANRSGRLDQTSIASLLENHGSGPAVVPGRPESSNLVARIRAKDPDLLMPPDDVPLPDESIAAIEQWIRDGAVWPAQNPSPPRRSGRDRTGSS